MFQLFPVKFIIFLGCFPVHTTYLSEAGRFLDSFSMFLPFVFQSCAQRLNAFSTSAVFDSFRVAGTSWCSHIHYKRLWTCAESKENTENTRIFANLFTWLKASRILCGFDAFDVEFHDWDRTIEARDCHRDDLPSSWQLQVELILPQRRWWNQVSLDP